MIINENEHKYTSVENQYNTTQNFELNYDTDSIVSWFVLIFLMSLPVINVITIFYLMSSEKTETHFKNFAIAYFIYNVLIYVFLAVLFIMFL